VSAVDSQRTSALTFDHPVPELIEEEDERTLAAIEAGVSQLNAGLGIPIEDMRSELANRRSK
jgi:hypothetical protein